jgi:hypothetical protein
VTKSPRLSKALRKYPTPFQSRTIRSGLVLLRYQLAVVNQGVIDSTCGNLMPGEQICLASTADEDCTDVYVVKQDDSCDAIASMSNLNSTILRLNNPQINDECDNIYVGEVSNPTHNIYV